MKVSKLTRESEFSVLLKPRLLLNWWKVWKSLPIPTWIKAAERFRSGDFRTAALYYKKGVQRYPEHRAALCARLDYAYCLYRMGQLEAALQELSQLVKTDSCMREVFILLAKLQIFTGAEELALQTLRRGVKKFPKDAGLFICYAYNVIAYGRTAEFAFSLKDTLEALRFNLELEDEKVELVNTALALYEIRYGSTERGDQILSRVIASGSAPLEAILLRGERLLESKRFEQGKDLIRRAMELAPRDPRPAVLLARHYLETQDKDTLEWAAQLAHTACEQSSWKDPAALAVYADVLEIRGDIDAASLYRARSQALRSVGELNLDSIKSVKTQLEQLRQI